MPISRPEMERRIARNTNDIGSVYDLLSEHTARFDTIDAKLASHDARFDSLDTNVSEILRRLPD